MLIVGAGGFAKQLLPVIEHLGLSDQVTFYDDYSNDTSSLISRNFHVIRNEEQLRNYFSKGDFRFVNALGGPSKRYEIHQKIVALGGIPTNLIDPNTRISQYEVKIGIGCCILQDVIIEPCAQLGDGCLINLKSMITHDTIIGNFTEISPGVTLLGASKIGNFVFIGAGAIVLPKIEIGDHCVIGAGAVVNRSVPSGHRVVGVPAR